MAAGRSRINNVYRGLNRPLTILGAERTLFFGAVIVGTLTFQLLQTIVGAVLLFVVLLIGAQRATKSDPRFVRVMRRASALRSVYDGSKYRAAGIRVLRARDTAAELGVVNA